MLRNYFTSLLLLLSIATLAQPCRQIIGYYPSWKWYNRKFLVNPSSIDYSKYSILNYAFFQPNPDGSIKPFDPRADKTLLLGEIKSSAPPGYSRGFDLGRAEWHVPGTSLVAKAHEANTKVLISIGGWTLSEHFSAIAADENKRAQFAKSCSELVRVYDIDGVDIDWEYPGYAAHNGSPADKENFTLLLHAIKDSFLILEKELDKKLLLTAAFGVAPSRMAFIEWDKVIPLLDYINLMTYDFYGSSPALTNHHAPLFSPARGLDGFNLHSVVHHLMDKYAVPSDKINIGMAFYGRSLKTAGKPDLHTSSRRMSDQSTFPEDKGNPMFYNIVARQELFQYHWDHLAQVPFLNGKNALNTFVSFDDEYSIALKARYVLHHNLAGSIVWDITGDYIETQSGSGIIVGTPLAEVLNRALCSEQYLASSTTFKKAESGIMLSPLWCAVITKVYPPRLMWSQKLSKKEIRKLERKQKKLLRNKKNQKTEVPDRYFNGGW